MPQVVVFCPFGEFDLGHQFRLQPMDFPHFFDRDAFAPVTLRAAGQVGKGTFFRLEFFHGSEKLRAVKLIKTTAEGISRDRGFVLYSARLRR